MNEAIAISILCLFLAVSYSIFVSKALKSADKATERAMSNNSKLIQELMKIRNPEVELAALRVKEESAVAKIAMERGSDQTLTDRQFRMQSALTSNVMPGNISQEELDIMNNGMDMG